MLNEVLASLNNYFDKEERFGEWIIEDGTISLPFLQHDQYFRIEGSVFNDGVYKNDGSRFLTNETFTGSIYSLAIPQEVLKLSEEISAWCKNNEAQLMSPFQSESFGGYSYTKASGQSGGQISWQDVFRSKMRRWRKL